MDHHPIRCACGTVQGQVRLPATTGRAVCYCKDCQAFAHFLKRPGILDEAGGSDIVAVAPSQVVLERGADAVACMSLSPKGLLRWYAACCNTPLGNTPRNPKVHYVGLLHNALDTRDLAASFGTSRCRVNTGSAQRKVSPTPATTVWTVLNLMKAMLPARFSGRWRRNPFFDAGSGAPVKAPRVLSRAERAAVTPVPGPPPD